MHLILPKALPDINKDPFLSMPLFFLAGPIKGGGDWQARMCELLANKFEDCIVANPCRYDALHPLYQYRLPGVEQWDRQRGWERYFLQKAGLEWKRGCIIFYLPLESRECPRDDGLPYAMDTRGEIGEWRTHMMYDANTRVVFGAEDGFPGLRTIEYDNEQVLQGRLQTLEGMETVVAAAIAMADPQYFASLARV